jgi:hypothetical protein
VLQDTVIPVCTEPSTEQTPPQDWRQLQEIGDVPQLLVPHVTSTAPPALMKQSWPAGHVREDGLGQVTAVHAPVATCHLGSTVLPATQDATVRPAPAQSS